jgi:hypothetical protein
MPFRLLKLVRTPLAARYTCRPQLGVFSAVLWAATLLPQPQAAAFKEQIGYNALVTEFGSLAPDGSGVVVSQVEALQNGNYMPSASNSQFTGKTIVNGGGPSSGTSSHANGVGFDFYGNTSGVASGVTHITVYEADHYMNNILRMVAQTNPILQTFKVQNHSWIGSFPNTGQETQVLQRLDYVIDRQDMIAVVGMDNSAARTMEDFPLLATSYNGIAVGRSSGGHAIGLTALPAYGLGRQKPEVVAPADSVSRATAITSGVAAALYESGLGTDAVRSETMKAIVLAGATKDEFAGWSRTTTTPLDDTYGAGEVNVLNSYLIQSAGKQSGSANQPAGFVDWHGWDYSTLAEDGLLHYRFEVPEYQEVSLSAVLAWNVEIFDTNTGNLFHPDETLVNLDLKLFNSSSTFPGAIVDQSISTVDNVEHIYQMDLAPGTYTLQISHINDMDDSENESRDFGVAWRLDAVPTYREFGDYNGNGVVEAGDYTMWRNTLGSVVHLQADGDLDGIVDQDDYDVWATGFGISFIPAGASGVAVIPEPSAWLLALLSAAWAARRARRRCL